MELIGPPTRRFELAAQPFSTRSLEVVVVLLPVHALGRRGGEVFETMPEEEFLGELAEKTTSVTIEEFTAEGVRMTYNLQGRMRGLYEADHLETVDAVFRPDGTYVFDQRGIDQTDKGEMILIRAKGTGTPVSPTAIHAQGEATFQTMS